ncbi:MAG: 2-C-methyl-D-erythritol 4-phosphate cytidylyltransferase, partial [Spirochaetaceae bacterium]|nr:2-C-methyl-D-erythritol 4-phosphate cytidylyltransferase [Spirochaetaceae bacterium]
MTDAAVVITAAGSSTRIGAGIKKEYLPLKHGTVLSEAARAFLKAVPVQFLVITHPEGRKTDAENALFSDREISNLSKNTKIVFTAGGKDRESSVFNALKTLAAAGFSP